MEVFLKNYHGSDTIIKYQRRGDSLYFRKDTLLDYFSQPECLTSATVNSFSWRGKKWIKLDFEDLYERFIREIDKRLIVRLLQSIK